MAALIPSDIKKSAGNDKHAGEYETLVYLGENLSDDYTVFHGVHWTLEGKKRTRFGEIDFVILNRSGHALIIEQKNGALKETDDGLVKPYFIHNSFSQRFQDTATKDKNVAAQVQRALESIRDKFSKQNTGHKGLVLDYIIYCPDYNVVNVNSTAMDGARIVDSKGRGRLAERITRLLGPGECETEAYAKAVFDFFLKTYEIVPNVHAFLGAQKKSYTRLTGGLIKIIDNLDMSPFRLKVSGVAGCGKSHLARHFYDKSIEEGKRPLLVCFNRPLRERLKNSVQEGGSVYTFLGLLSTFLYELGHEIEYDKMNQAGFWGKIQDQVLDQSVPDEWKYDVIIIDEAQDLGSEQHELLQLFMKEDSDVLCLEDSSQNIWQRKAYDDHAFLTYRADTNYRSPYLIADFIKETLPFEFEVANPLPGLGVSVTGYNDPGEQIGLLENTLNSLLKVGFAHNDIVILSCRGISHASLSDTKRIGKHTIRQFTGKYDELGNQLFTEGDIYFDSIGRFKGQQSPVVLLTDVDPKPEKWEREQCLLFTGMTRATVRLEMLVNQNNDLCQPFIKAATQ